MKIGVWLNENNNPKIGGGFFYVDKLIKLIDEKQFHEDLNVVFLTKTKNHFLGSNKEVIFIDLTVKLPFHLKIILKISNRFFFLKLISKKIYNYKNKLLKEKINNQFKNYQIDLIYYLSQMEREFDGIPFISSNWDIGHLSMYAFPEVTENRNFERRNNWYNNSLKKAVSIFAESYSGKQELIDYLSINPDRIKVLPIFPGNVISINLSEIEQQRLLGEFNIEKGKYFFYPAQFWAHKNHFNLIKAFKLFLKKHTDIKLVFTGSDKGNLKYILELIEKENLKLNVLYLGFLQNEKIYSLYKNAIALVMPTFLGPTNMPLLEARSLGCPVLCSDFKGHREQLSDGAIYFNPLEKSEIYDSLISIMDSSIREEILIKANKNAVVSKFNEKNAIKTLERNLIDISKYKNCWG